jgi:transcription-repair coupling factor (superfamily II helicase)
MLDHAVKALKEGREPALDKPLVAATEVELRLPAFVPETYIADVHVRLGLYKRIAAAESNEALDELNSEMYDRFGSLPPSAQSLLKIAKLKLAARAIGVRRLDIGPQGGSVTFEEKNSIDSGTVVRMVQKGARDYRLEGPLKMRLTRQLPTEEQRFVFAEALLKLLGEKAKPAEPTPPAPAKAPPPTTGAKRK